MVKKYFVKLTILSLVIITGASLHIFGLLQPQRILEFASGYTDHWFFFVVLVVLQVLLYTFALTGSLVLWVVAPLYSPEIATLILVIGGTIGGVSAYYFSRQLTNEWKLRIEKSHAYKLIHKQNSFFTLFALRVFPGFPHSFINYSAGIFNTRLNRFIPATVLGISIKYYVYSNVIHNATNAASLEDLLGIDTYGPLILLSALALIGASIKQRTTEAK